MFHLFLLKDICVDCSGGGIPRQTMITNICREKNNLEKNQFKLQLKESKRLIVKKTVSNQFYTSYQTLILTFAHRIKRPDRSREKTTSS